MAQKRHDSSTFAVAHEGDSLYPCIMKNRLAQAASPYLRQHEDNPVDWYPWGPEALARAKTEDKPILLSIGYSACHWCHVMAHESFEDPEIAEQMNRLFVNVKVDREERPDLDQIYQLCVQVMGRSGGWPLTVFLTPDQRPFFAGTYFPKTDQYGMPGFPTVLGAVAEAFRERRSEVEQQAASLASAVASVTRDEVREATARAVKTAVVNPGGEATEGAVVADPLDRAARIASRKFDDAHGGFGTRPKFPNTMALDVLLRRGAEGDLASEKRVRKALLAMRSGGVYDQIGGGFHRYSTDAQWLVPHFEKMLYDNALLTRLYVDAARAFGEPRFADVALEVLSWVEREMTAPSGAFYATLDADSVPLSSPKEHPAEGAFYTWSQGEIRAALGADEEAASVALLHFGVTADGNFDDPHAPLKAGEEPRSVLSEAQQLDLVAAQLDVPVERAREAAGRAKAVLFHDRERRPRPFRDEKILTCWNALMISAACEVYAATSDATALKMAERAMQALTGPGGVVGAAGVQRLLSTSEATGSSAGAIGFLDDYAFLAVAALDCYEVTQTKRYVDVAKQIVDVMLSKFWDEADGGFYFTPSDGEALIHRPKEIFDQAIPSGTSMAALVLLRLFALTGEARYERQARATLEPLAQAATSNPLGFSQTVIVLDRLVRGSTDVVVVGSRADARTRSLLDAVLKAYVPHRTLAQVDPDEPETAAACPALAEGKEAKRNAVAYLCRGRTCSPPIGDASALAAALRSASSALAKQ